MGSLTAQLRRDPWFLAGLALRLALLVAITPSIHLAWFTPFLRTVTGADAVDVWSAFLAQGGDRLAFPYGLPYVAVYGPAVWLGELLAGLARASPETVAFVASVFLRVALFALDFALLRLLARWTGETSAAVRYYWLSPIVIFIIYWYGQLDILPTLLLMLAVIAVVERRMRGGAVLFGVACAAKLSMLAAAPFFGIFLLRNRLRRDDLIPFVAISAGVFLVLMAPLVLSPGAREMVFGNREFQKVYDLFLPVGDARVFIAPVAYAAIAYLFWNIRRIPSALFVSIVGAGFLPILLLTPAAPGWFLWIAPFLFLHQMRHTPSAVLLAHFFAVSVVLANLPVIDPPFGPDGSPIDIAGLLAHLPVDARLIHDWLRTAMTAFGLLLTGQMLRDGLFRSAHYQLGRRRLAIGIAGDSGAGKDTLAESVIDLFGKRSVTHVSGDDYHVWDRARPMWSALTHLNPAANRLSEMTRDALRLGSGASILNRHYDHGTGLMSRPRRIAPSDIVLVSGLHALYPPDLRARLDLKVFLDMDDGLRRVLKIARDTRKRGQPESVILESIERRAPDRERFIQPQRAYADLVFALTPPSPREIARAKAGKSCNLDLHVSMDPGASYEDLARLLIASGIAVSVDHEPDGRVRLQLSGEPDADLIAALSRRLIPDVEEFVELAHGWRSGWLGMMQLFMVLTLVNRFRRDVAWG